MNVTKLDPYLNLVMNLLECVNANLDSEAESVIR